MTTADKIKTRNAPGVQGLRPPAADYVVGIDTGGTYTDGVLLDYRTREVLASAKTLTTYEDLTVGINKVLRELRIESPARVKLVGISSTLATNSIAEGNIKPVGLALLGYDRELIESYGLESRLSASTLAYFRGGHNSQGEEQCPPDLQSIQEWVREQGDAIQALAISSYFSPLNPSHEEQAIRAVREVTDVPVVLGHQLSTQLDSVRRATTASLNASLVAVMHGFIQAVKRSLKDLGFNAPLMIVKGDGSLMPYAEAAQKPVETVLSGPAASTIGGRFLSRKSEALVVDVGGTTTDMALIEDGTIRVTDEGARVGEVETAVKAARIRTVCIGCDSRISMNSDKEFQVGPNRVVPLSRLAASHPEIGEELLGIFRRRRTGRSQADIEYWFLAKEGGATQAAAGDPRKQALLELLRERPLSLHDLLEAMRVNHSVQLAADDLLQSGVIGVAALTPTDLLHFRGELDLGHAEAAKSGLEFLCALFGRRPKDFADQVLEHIVDRMAEEAVVFLARESHDLPEGFDGRWAEWFFRQGMKGDNPHLSVALSSRFPVIGIGAPADIFVRRVAERLHTRFVLPPHPHVANAVGAVAGSVIVDKEALVYVQETDEARSYVVQLEGETTTFMESQDALEYAESRVSGTAREAAENAGAESPQIQVQRNTEGALQRIRARAVGNPRLSEQFG
jgi:N-methylhydantoinase A/oxoprolinase/acetone carboxylase beta subunit